MSSPAASLALNSSPIPREQQSSKVLGNAFLAALWMAMIWIILDLPGSVYETWMLVLILTAVLLPLAILHTRGDLDIFEPIMFANLGLASMFLGRPIFDISTDSWVHMWFATYFDARPGFDAMLYYALLGIVALQVGYLSPLGLNLANKLPSYRHALNINRVFLISIFTFLVGAVLFEEYVRQSGGAAFLAAYLTSRNLGAGFSYKTASGYLYIGPLFWPPAGMIGFATWLRTRKPAHLYFTIFVLLCFFISMLGGVGRTFEIQGALGIFLIAYIGRRKRPSMLLVVAISVVGLLYLVYERSARSLTTLDQKERAMQTVLDHPLDAIVTIWSQDDAAMCDYFSLMVANIPDRIPFDTGSTITDSMLRAYPRFLWPGKKPDEHMTALFKEFFPAIRYRYTTGAASSVISEFYDDHGAITVILGMFAFGVLLSVPKRWMERTNGAIPAQLLFVAMPAYTISLMRGGISAFVEYIAITLIPIVIIHKYASQPGTSYQEP